MCSSLAGDGFPASALLEEIGYGVGFNPFANIGGFLVTALAVAASGACIYLFDAAVAQRQYYRAIDDWTHGYFCVCTVHEFVTGI